MPVDRSRLHANGRHFSLMRAVVMGEARGIPSKEMHDLISWGYVFYDGQGYSPTEIGAKANGTWQNMKEAGER